jgi:glucose-1-phosphatase
VIRNIIFDLGGVLINLDMEATAREFIALGMTDFNAHYSKARQSGLFDAFDRGAITPEEFRTGLKKYLPPGITDAQIDHAWNAMLLDIPEERLTLLKELKGKYRLFLLSNTNEIHVDAFSAYLKRRFGHEDFSPYFERWYYSCRIGKRKPSADAFRHVLDENKLELNETVFIDDSEQHILGAKQIGLRAEFLRVHEDEELMEFWKRVKL